METGLVSTVNLIAKDGHKINVYCWEEVEKPRAV